MSDDDEEGRINDDRVASEAKRARLERNQYKRPLEAWKFKKRVQPILVKDWEVTPSPASVSLRHTSSKKAGSAVVAENRVRRHVRPAVRVPQQEEEQEEEEEEEEEDEDGGNADEEQRVDRTERNQDGEHLTTSPRQLSPPARTHVPTPRRSPRAVHPLHSSNRPDKSNNLTNNTTQISVVEDETRNRQRVTSRREVALSKETIAKLEQRRQNVSQNYSKMGQSHSVTLNQTRDPEALSRRQEFLRQKRSRKENSLLATKSASTSQEVGSPRHNETYTDPETPQTMNDVSLIRVSEFRRRKQLGQITDLDVAHSLLMTTAKQFEIEEDDFEYFKSFVKTVEMELAKSVGSALELKQKKQKLNRDRKTVEDLCRTLTDLQDRKQTLRVDYELSLDAEKRARTLADISEWTTGLVDLMEGYQRDQKMAETHNRRRSSSLIQISGTPAPVGNVLKRIRVVRQQMDT